MARSRLVLQKRKRDQRTRQANGVKDYSYQTPNPFRVELFCRGGNRPEEGKNLLRVPWCISDKAGWDRSPGLD